ncbi:MAG: ribosome biogenesis GTP-binding protein YihA/YsxC [Thermoanaerobaculia bacterium]|nr:ribosome biogenesis GTP-binding protein YihA/YsxC [Thermoanaerobaculia bacterium]
MRIDTARFELAAHSRDEFPRDGRPEVTIVGRSNVGKSSLLNSLVGQTRLARTSSTPGRTRAVNYFLINERWYLVDLPGYGYAKVAMEEREAWRRLMDEYFRQGPDDRLLIQLVDAKVGATPLDVEARDYLRALGGDGVVVATKIDRIGRGRRKQALESIRRELELGDRQVLPFSARTGEGKKELWRAIDSRIAGTTSERR